MLFDGEAQWRPARAATAITGLPMRGENMAARAQSGVIAFSAVTRVGAIRVTNDYVYAGTGHTELLAHEVPGKGTYKYTYGRNKAIGQPVIEQVTVGTATAYLENDASGTPIMLRSSAGMHALYIYDNLGSPAALITTANSTAFTYKFDPYGAPELTEDSGGLGTRQTPFISTGGLNDRTTGWVLNGARYYDPAEGRWTQHDTLDAPLDPGNANRYAYAANNPVNYIDPLGTVTMGGVVGAVVGTVFGSIGAAALCAGSGGIGCAAVAGAFFGGISGMTAGGLEAKIDGGDVRQGAIDGGVYGAITGGLSSVARLISILIDHRTDVQTMTPATAGPIVLFGFIGMFLILVVTMVVQRELAEWWLIALSLFGIAAGFVAFYVGRRNTPQ